MSLTITTLLYVQTTRAHPRLDGESGQSRETLRGSEQSQTILLRARRTPRTAATQGVYPNLMLCIVKRDYRAVHAVYC